MNRHQLFPVCLLSLALFSCKNTPTPGSLSPAEALKTFQLPEGFQIELFAAEPLIRDPIAMEVDEYGRLYVLEMPGYPSDLTKTGAVKLLSDTDGDGLPDKSTVFVDKLTLPGGLMRWKKGLILVDPPEVLYFEDTDGDGKSDKREVLLTGLALSNPQHNANTPMLGMDNWIYIAHSSSITPKVAMEFDDEGSEVYFPAKPDGVRLPQNANGRNIRFKPDTYELEMLSGETQFGQTFDAWGHQFCTENAHHLFHEVIAARYLARNPALLVPDATADIPDHGDACEVFSITQNPEHQLLTDVGIMTSACGVTWYDGGLFPKEFDKVIFTAEPVHNLVHADRITDKGATFTASRVYENREFLASTDPWFRPVNFYVGPEGALYVIDYYRQIVEHPEWMSEEVNQSGALYNGTDKGRIYRVTPTGTAKADWLGKLKTGDASAEELWQGLVNQNIWHRRTAQRLLLDRPSGEETLVWRTGLEKMFGKPGFLPLSSPGLGHILWTIEGLGKMSVEALGSALSHPISEGVRENALKIAERHLGEMPELESELLAIANDTSPKVRYQLLLTLGFLTSEKAAAARQQILVRDIEDPWVQYAALSAGAGSEQKLYDAALTKLRDMETPGRQLFFENCAAVIALSGDTAGMKRLVHLALKNPTAKDAWWQSATLSGLTKALGFSQLRPFGESERVALAACFSAKTPSQVRRAAIDLTKIAGLPKWEILSKVSGEAEKIMRDKTADITFREDAVRLLAAYVGHKQAPAWGFLLSPEEPANLQKTALEAMRQSDALNCIPVVLERWNSLSPEVRDEALTLFYESDATMKRLLDALESKAILPGSLAWNRQVSLINHDDPDIRNRARKLLTVHSENRSEVLKHYQPSLSRTGDAIAGAAVFKKACGQCHQVSGQHGVAFGPDLGPVRNRHNSFILIDILDPNRSIADGYAQWLVERKSGAAVAGIIASETAASITLRDQTGKETSIARGDILKMETSEVSPMPQGLEGQISVEEMGDLLAFLRKG